MSLKVLLQYALPHHLLSRVVFHATRWTWRPWKDFLIDQIVRRYRVDMSEAAQPDPHAYPHFNAFFTRVLRDEARPEPADPHAIACPADGRVSQAGRIREGRIFQAKSQTFSVAELLGDEAATAPYADGHFVTVYLSPRDYHRVHMPLAGTLQRTTHVPGRIFSVAPFAVRAIPRLFARNERLVCHFDGEYGPFAVVLVGAMLVSSVTTAWDGLVIPPRAHAISHSDCRPRQLQLDRQAQLGHFNMGSTVIVLLPAAARMNTLSPDQAVRMGQAIGTSG
ncbi:MAG TPA: archaetidylserine decarboxylase [Oleiagrimonas sp.]|nr:archaetidylserine decarboxylase [Oleiagrimonas sp.]